MDHDGYVQLLRQRRERLHATMETRKARIAARQEKEARQAAAHAIRRKRAQDQAEAAPAPPRIETAPCPICNTIFSRNAANPSALKTCGAPDCRRIGYQFAKRASRAKSKHNERQRPGSPPASRVDLDALWARAQGRCQAELPSGHLCGRICHIGHPDLRAPDRATRGHRQSLTLGGLESYDNTFLQCAACAASKPRLRSAPTPVAA